MLALLPNIGPYQQGAHYGFALDENVTLRGTLTRYAVEDGQLSIINDHFRDEPARVDGTFKVTTVIMSGANKGELDLTLPSRFYDALTRMRALQSVDPTTLLTLNTGVIVLENMAIKDITIKRTSRDAQGGTFRVTFEEIRIATQPRRVGISLDAASAVREGGTNLSNVAPEDRPILEGTNYYREAQPVVTSRAGVIGTNPDGSPNVPSSWLLQILPEL